MSFNNLKKERRKEKMENNVCYAVRLETKQVRETDFPYNGQSLSCTNEVLAFVNSLQDSDVEKFLVLHLNSQNVLNCIQVIIGTLNMAVVYPREVIKHAILSNSCSIIQIHNHPSGKERPSESEPPEPPEPPKPPKPAELAQPSAAKFKLFDVDRNPGKRIVRGPARKPSDIKVAK